MSLDALTLTHSGIQSLQPYVPGKPVEELERELGIKDSVKLASNESPLGVNQALLAELSGYLGKVNLYPDANAYQLKQALSAQLGLSASQFTLGNGSNDVLDMIARAFAGPGQQVIVSEFAFLVYPIVAKLVNADLVTTPALDWGHDLSAMKAAITEKTSLIFIANPNNPTGTWLKSAALKSFLEGVPEHVIVVLDEAYFEYVTEADYPDSVKWLSTFPNLIITRTFSKAYGLAGLRIGYAMSSPAIADILNRIRQPFNNNVFALIAAEKALSDAEFLRESVAVNQQGLVQLMTFFNERGIEYIPSVANFITFRVGPNAMDIYNQLLRKGVIVRPIANYNMPHYLRVSIGLAAQNQRFIHALSECL